MSTIPYTSPKISPPNKLVHILWEGLTGGDDGAPMTIGQFADRTVQVIGTFSGATTVIEGSLDGTTWATLSDTNGNSLSLSATGIYTITQVPRYLRPKVTGGTGSTDIDIHLLARGLV